MRAKCVVMLMAVTAAYSIPSVAGTVTGTVKLDGVAPKGRPIDMAKEPVCAKAWTPPVTTQQVVVGPGNGLENVVVYVSAGLPDKSFDPPSTPVVIDQKNCMYGPHVIALQVNQTLKVINSDPHSHNIHPLPTINREWNKSQPPGSAPLEQKFDKEEISIPVKCNIHPWMRSYIAVFKHPYFSVTGPDGSFSIKNLPPGKYTVTAWQETYGSKTQDITVGAGASNASFEYKAK